MALPTTVLETLTHKYIDPTLADNAYDSNPVLMRLRQKGVRKSIGLQVQLGVIYAKGRGGSYAGFDTHDVRPKAKKTSALFDLKLYEEPVVYSGEEMLKNTGPEAVIDHIETEWQIADLNIADNLGTGIFGDGTGNNGKDMVGFKAMLSTASTYGEIAVADFSGWVAQIDSSTTTLTYATITKQIGTQTVGKDKPTLIISNQGCLDKAKTLFQPQQRFQDDGLLKAGFDNILMDGIPWTVDSHAPGSGYGTADNYIIFANERYLFFYIHPDRDFKRDPIQKPINQDAYIGHVYYAGAFACNNRRMQGAMTTINPSL